MGAGCDMGVSIALNRRDGFRFYTCIEIVGIKGT